MVITRMINVGQTMPCLPSSFLGMVSLYHLRKLMMTGEWFKFYPRKTSIPSLSITIFPPFPEIDTEIACRLPRTRGTGGRGGVLGQAK